MGIESTTAPAVGVSGKGAVEAVADDIVILDETSLPWVAVVVIAESSGVVPVVVVAVIAAVGRWRLGGDVPPLSAVPWSTLSPLDADINGPPAVVAVVVAVAVAPAPALRRRLPRPDLPYLLLAPPCSANFEDFFVAADINSEACNGSEMCNGSDSTKTR